MATFNYDIKKQTYELALNQTRELLKADDRQNGLFYLDKAIALSEELIVHCIVPQLKARFVQENQKLKEVKVALTEKGFNPFLPSSTPKPVNNVVQGTTPTQGGTNGPVEGPTTKKEGGNDDVSLFFSEESPTTTLKDIAGLEEVKEQILLNVIAPMKKPDIYFKYVDEVGCQILMYGPPGCGKTFVAEAIAGELKCAYAIINTHDILDKYVGEAPKKIAQIFKEAEKYKNCLIFFDELDALFASRESGDSSHTKDILTSFLTCLSGFKSKSEERNIRVVIGATNRPWALDSAVLRGKRFDTQIYVGLPDHDARLFLVEKAFKKRPGLLNQDEITYEDLVEMFDGYSGADITTMLEKMKKNALKRALMNAEDGEEGLETIGYEDAKEILSKYRNSVTKESLDAFEAFRDGEI
ncbi:MAG: ATP-binding protein [Clostridia bacterium]|nr:ATP-binding protein [Clostridia bacterium]